MRVKPFRVLPSSYSENDTAYMIAEKSYVGMYVGREGEVIDQEDNELVVQFPAPCPFCGPTKNDHSTTMRFKKDEVEFV